MKAESPEILDRLCEAGGDAFYILDTDVFDKNFRDLEGCLRAVYPDTTISYSYKTNYTPAFCRLVDRLGGYAEVVSDMEASLALALGIPHRRIIFNGPYKTEAFVEQFLLSGGQVNLDGAYELEMVSRIASRHSGSSLRVALRCNFDIGDGVVSRFGFDVYSPLFVKALDTLRSIPEIQLEGLHCHFATRKLESFRARAEGLLEVMRRHFDTPPAYLCLGGGLFGRMEDSLKSQFDVPVPDYTDYAEAIARPFAEAFGGLAPGKRPVLFVEPGSAIVGDAMRFVATVNNIKTVRGKVVATLSGSIYNINPTLNKKNPPIVVVPAQPDRIRGNYEDLDFAGYTCIESDYLYRGYSGPLAVGDRVVFGNVGSYSLVLKPPFIRPNLPVLELCDGQVVVHRCAETWEQVFGNFIL